jgi:DNA-binding beta-propeller fold protein YncE
MTVSSAKFPTLLGLGMAGAAGAASLVTLGVLNLSTPASSSVPTAVGVTASIQKSIHLPGVGGKGDVVVADPGAHRVYLAQSPDNNVVVINTTTNSIQAVIGHVPKANGIAYSPDYLFVSEGPTKKVAVISKTTWRVTATVPSGGTTPDAIYYDAPNDTVFVTNDDSNTMEFFSARAPFTVGGSIALHPTKPAKGPDLGTYVPDTNTLYQSDDNLVLVINAARHTITNVLALPLPPAVRAKDMFYDGQRRLLWVSTNATQILAIDPGTGRVLHKVATASGADQISGDQQHRLLYLGEGKAGVMGVIDLDTAGSTNFTTEKSTHTLATPPTTDLVYLYRDLPNRVDVVKIARN